MFPAPSADAWRAAAEAELKGAPFTRLVTQTREGIDLQPIAWPADLAAIPYLNTLPGQSPFLRGAHGQPPLDGAWLVCARIAAHEHATAASQAHEALAHGATALELAPHSSSELALALEGIVPTAVALFVQAEPGQLRAFGEQLAALAGSPQQAQLLRGALVLDPFARLAAGTSGSIEATLQELADIAVWAASQMPRLLVLASDATVYHEAGGSAVEELAFGLAGAVEQVRMLIERGASIELLAPHMRFEFAVGTQVAMEVAKLRAARVLWAKAAAAFGAAPDARRVMIHARSSLRNKTRYDRHVNLLRGAAEGFAAVLGGCDSLEIAPFDLVVQTPDSHSRRLALNTQHLLRDEAHLDRVLDPAGGAWSLEVLTDTLARRAWALFQDVEHHGGMLAALRGGFPQERLADLAARRAADVGARRMVLVGTNRYADPSEPAPPQESHTSLAASEPPTEEVIRVAPRRDAAAFERLRDHVRTLPERPRAWLANFGSRAEFRARADFVTELLQVGGIEVIDTPGLATASQAAAAAIGAGAPIIVVCAADSAYPMVVPELVERVRATLPTTVFALVGHLPQQAEALRNAGIDVFLRLHADAVEMLASIVARIQEVQA
jgi:methylmalonyl-CoA mutase